jgi:hypothetical protein
MTKLDGTARGGVLVAAAEQYGLPIHAIGVGEKIDDLRPFDPDLVRASSRELPDVRTAHPRDTRPTPQELVDQPGCRFRPAPRLLPGPTAISRRLRAIRASASRWQ